MGILIISILQMGTPESSGHYQEMLMCLTHAESGFKTSHQMKEKEKKKSLIFSLPHPYQLQPLCLSVIKK